MNKIKQYRKRHKLSQLSLAELLCVNVRSVQRWEAGDRQPHKMVYLLLQIIENIEILQKK